ncbi:MAG TPA: 4a-hydroxytetrahydrobiopterin dehydratase [Planctomycetota bacterium]|jgi:4a-hydroxytetrahydrobiopterin dehydratase|nr:4a-hydroxytetrahydrobiopterin dehydratase [Planctomycetota bacterium]
MDLTKKKCRPCDGGVKPLSPDDARVLAAQVPRWKLRKDEPRLWREYIFKDFVRAMKFVNKVAEIAEAENHHPDVHIHYNKVKLVLWTHDIGGLSENDFIVAAKVDELNG